MPRVNPLRSLANERNLARRIAFERDERQMSLDGLAKRMTDIGMPMQKTTIYKIEQGDPPRRITVDELVGFAKVFDLDVDELLLPVELVHDREARRHLEELGEAAGRMAAAVEAMFEARVSLERYLADDPSRQSRLLKLTTGSLLEGLRAAKPDSPIRKISVREAFAAWERGDHLPYPKAVDESMDRLFGVIERCARSEARS